MISEYGLFSPEGKLELKGILRLIQLLKEVETAAQKLMAQTNRGVSARHTGQLLMEGASNGQRGDNLNIKKNDCH